MTHSRSAARLLVSAALSLLSMSAMAAAPAPSTGDAHSKPGTLDLSTPPIEKILTQAQIDEVLAHTFDRPHLEEVEVPGARVREPFGEDYIPPGFAAMFWAAGHPSGLWKIFAPFTGEPKIRTRSESDPTNPGRPAPGIPAMAGEIHPFDR